MNKEVKPTKETAKEITETKETTKENKPFKERDIVTAIDVAERFGVCYTKATELIKMWKYRLRGEGRDELDMNAKLTKVDYAYILGIDIKLLY